MKPEPVEARSLPELVPAPVDIARLDWCADSGGKDEPVLSPCFAECETLSVLTFSGARGDGGPPAWA